MNQTCKFSYGSIEDLIELEVTMLDSFDVDNKQWVCQCTAKHKYVNDPKGEIQDQNNVKEAQQALCRNSIRYYESLKWFVIAKKVKSAGQKTDSKKGLKSDVARPIMKCEDSLNTKCIVKETSVRSRFLYSEELIWSQVDFGVKHASLCGLVDLNSSWIGIFDNDGFVNARVSGCYGG